MNGLIRRLAVLSVLWSLVELVMPMGRQQTAVRMIMGVLMMTALLTHTGQWLGKMEEMPAWSVQIAQAGEENYRRTALSSLANQVESYCVRQAQKAGYEAAAKVWLRISGELERIELELASDGKALLSPEELRSHLAVCLQTDTGRIQLEGI